MNININNPLKAANDDTVTCQLRFPGQYEDNESGLFYNRHRYYDPETAQYLSPDPIGLLGGINPYGYVHNSTGWVDPIGLAGDCNAGKRTNSTLSNPIINPAINKVVIEYTFISSGKTPKTSTPNSIYEISRSDGSISVTYYDEKGNMFSIEDYGQQKTPGKLGYDANGKVPLHEHKQTYKSHNDKIYKNKSYYRQIDKNDKPINPWILDK